MSVEAGGERAGVELTGVGSAWWAGRVQLEFKREGRGGAALAFEPQRRWSTGDQSFAASGYRQLAGWTVSARAGCTPRASFYYRWAAEGELSRRLAGGWVAGAGYRRVEFPSAVISLWAPSLTVYGRSGEAQARLSLVTNHTLGTRSQSALVRALWTRGGRWQLGGGAALGENLYDVTALARRPARGWVAFAHGRVAVSARESLAVELRLAHEQPHFRQLALGCYVRRTF